MGKQCWNWSSSNCIEAWNGVVWLKKVVEFCECGDETSGSIKWNLLTVSVNVSLSKGDQLYGVVEKYAQCVWYSVFKWRMKQLFGNSRSPLRAGDESHYADWLLGMAPPGRLCKVAGVATNPQRCVEIRKEPGWREQNCVGVTLP